MPNNYLFVKFRFNKYDDRKMYKIHQFLDVPKDPSSILIIKF